MKSLFKLIKSFKSLKLFKLIRPISRIKPIRLIRLIRPISLIRPIKFLKPARYKFITACLVLSLVLGGLFFTASPARADWPSWLKAPVVFVKKALAAINNITGVGTISFLPLFTGADNPSNTIGDSIVYDDGAGHIGISTTAPVYKLQVALPAAGVNSAIGFNVTGAGGGGAILFNGSNGTANHIFARIDGQLTNGTTGSEAGDLVFWTGSGGGNAERLRINSAGNVGIGTAGPNNKLTVTGAADVSSFLRVGGNTGGAGIAGDISARRSANTGAYYFGDSSSNYLYFDGTNYQFGLGGLYVNTGGNVGIGTTNPTDAKLVVDGSARIAGTNPVFRISHTPGAVNMKNFQIQTDGTTLYFGSNNDDWSWKVSDILTLNENGDVGIGSLLRIGRANDPSAKLHVNGSMILTPLVADPASPVNGQMWMRQ